MDVCLVSWVKSCPPVQHISQRNVWSAEEWALQQANAIPFFGAAGIIIESLFFDQMHTKYLRVDSHVMGNILCYIAGQLGRQAGSAENRVERKWGSIEDACAPFKSACRYSSMSLSMFKASQTRHFLIWRAKLLSWNLLYICVHHISGCGGEGWD